MRICFFMLKLFFYCCCVRARYWRALKQRFVFAVHGFMMRFHFLLCLCLFIAIISIFSQRQPPHIAIPLSLSSITNAYFGCYSASWWLFCSHRNIASLSTGSHFLFLMLVFFCSLVALLSLSLSRFLLALSLSHSSEFNVGAGFVIYIISVAFRCRFCALIFVAYYIFHLIRQIVVAASPASTKMDIIMCDFFFPLGSPQWSRLYMEIFRIVWYRHLIFFFRMLLFQLNFDVFPISLYQMWTMTFHGR